MNLTSEKSYLYEFKITLFDDGDPEEFLLFVQNFQITLEVLWKLSAGVKIQYICTIVRGEALHQLEMLYVEVVNTTSKHLKLIILCLGV